MSRHLIIVFLFIATTLHGSPRFRTSEVQRLAEAIDVALPDNMPPGTDNDTLWSYQGRKLRVVTNALGDVSHIGFSLFNNEFLAMETNREVFYFIETLALQQKVYTDNELRDKLQIRQNKVTFLKGTPQLLEYVDSETPFRFETVELKGYRITFETKHGELVIMLPADYQLLTTTDARELESMMRRDLPRTRRQDITPAIVDRIFANSTHSVAADGTILLTTDTYLSEYVTGNVTLSNHADGQCEPQFAASLPLRSVRNLLITGAGQDDIILSLTFDLYGYQTETLEVTLQQFLTYCYDENCSVYVGIKTQTSEAVTATVFALNSVLGYNHMLSVTVPTSVLSGDSHTIVGRLYAYIPLYNVSSQFFNTTYIQVN